MKIFYDLQDLNIPELTVGCRPYRITYLVQCLWCGPFPDVTYYSVGTPLTLPLDAHTLHCGRPAGTVLLYIPPQCTEGTSLFIL